MRRGWTIAGLTALFSVMLPMAGRPQARPPVRPRPPAKRPAGGAPAPAALGPIPTDEAELYADSARRAWRFVEVNVQPSGLVNALAAYRYATVWDIGSGLAALYSAHELGLLDDARYDTHMRHALKTIDRMDLFDGAAYNKVYACRTGAMVGRNQAPSRRGYGWSAIDLGRLLLWLKIVATHQPRYAAEAETAARRLAPERVVGDGYMRGGFLEPSGRVFEYQEGRIGYEQYAARGFEAWGYPVEHALDLQRNGVPLTVMGKTLMADVRGNDRFTGEPFALMGLEVGYEPPERALAEALVQVMEERYRRSGRITMLAEDAINKAPHYFFYYCAYANGQEFALDVQEPHAVVDGPRWVSTKAAFAWRALFPNDYTRQALQAVMPSRTAAGWGSGVYEADGRPTGSVNINTQAVILEAALYRQRAAPLIEPRP